MPRTTNPILILGLLVVTATYAETPDETQSCHYEPTSVIRISPDAMPEAQKRAKLATLLIESLHGISNHQIDYQREREIKRLAKELGKEKSP